MKSLTVCLSRSMSLENIKARKGLRGQRLALWMVWDSYQLHPGLQAAHARCPEQSCKRVSLPRASCLAEEWVEQRSALGGGIACPRGLAWLWVKGQALWSVLAEGQRTPGALGAGHLCLQGCLLCPITSMGRATREPPPPLERGAP